MGESGGLWGGARTKHQNTPRVQPKQKTMNKNRPLQAAVGRSTRERERERERGIISVSAKRQKKSFSLQPSAARPSPTQPSRPTIAAVIDCVEPLPPTSGVSVLVSPAV